MARGNTIVLNVSGGETAGELAGRLDLPLIQRSYLRVQNYIVQSQGGLLYRNGLSHVKNTRSRQNGRLLSFTFSEQDTYVIEMTDKKLRFYRNFAAVLTNVKNISAITKANPAVVTANAHGYTNGMEVFITGVGGMKAVNGQFFLVANATTNTFQLKTVYDEFVDSTLFDTYTSGGTVAQVYEVDAPYLETHLKDIHYRQSADTIYLTHEKYAPFKLTRTDHTAWTIDTFTRTSDPFNQRVISGITKANPGVFTTTAAHGFAVDDEVFISNVGGMTEVNWNRYKVNTTPSTTTFTLKNATTGVALNTTSFTTYTSGGIVIQTKYCPRTLAFLDSTRLVYGNWGVNPAGLAFSRAPDPTTGATRFEDFTTGANPTDAVLFTLSPVFDKIDSIQWIANVNRQVVVGALSSIRRLHGDTIDEPISPSSVNSRPINSIGSARVQPYSSGQSVFYIDLTGRRLHSFLYTFQANDFATLNQNLVSTQLGSSPFDGLAQQRGDSGLLWVNRRDGVLLGLTFNEIESIFGWHRHYIGGQSVTDGVSYDRAKVLSITVEPRLGEESVLWAIVERTIGSKTYRSVEYLNQPVRFLESMDFLSTAQVEYQLDDEERFHNATFEQLKDSIHLDGCATYDGAALSTTVSMTPSAATGDEITITASAAFFDSSMVGREIWKKYNARGVGGGRAKITQYISTTVVNAEVLTDFDNAAAIPAGRWALTTDRVFGLLHLAGQTVDTQIDGAPGAAKVVASDGSIQLDDQASKVHVGFKYRGLAVTNNLDIASQGGSSQARIRRILNVLSKWMNTIGAKIGSTLWNVQPIIFKTLSDRADRPTRLSNGVQELRPEDSYGREPKQIVIQQDIPSPQNLLSLDVEMEVATD
ncbi:MAG: hypothetical protein K2Y32_00300 [Candidatus Obscuribacterales bacterium]|nr:hypothetical protein [Candidatus Obscuribacterales bacterium]